MKKIGTRIREAYLAAGMTRAAFARSIAVSYSTVCRWESGETEPSHAVLTRALEFFGEHVLGEEDSTGLPAELQSFMESEIGAPYTDEERSHLRVSALQYDYTPEGWWYVLQAFRARKGGRLTDAGLAASKAKRASAEEKLSQSDKPTK